MLVVPFVVEVTFQGTYGDRTWANVLHLVWDETTPGRLSAGLDTIATQMETAYVTNILDAMSDKVTLVDIKVQDVDSEGGLSVLRPVGDPGGEAGAGMPGNVAILVTKNDDHARSQRAGRFFFVGALEGDTDTNSPSTLNAGGIARWVAATGGFYTDLSGTAGGSDFYPVVLHKSSAPSGYTPYSLNSLSLNSRLATQRRRLRK